VMGNTIITFFLLVPQVASLGNTKKSVDLREISTFHSRFVPSAEVNTCVCIMFHSSIFLKQIRQESCRFY
jgi:hypothetical protein